MAGVVRRDGLREKYEPRAWTCPGCGWHTRSVEHEQHTCPTPLDAVPDVPPTGQSGAWQRAGRCAGCGCWHTHKPECPGDVLTDVPPDPPAVDLTKTRRRVLSALRTGRARAQAANSERVIKCSPNKPGWNQAKWNREHPHVDEDAAMADAVLDVMFAEGVLVDAADVRARGDDVSTRDDPPCGAVWSDPLTDTSEDLARLAAVREIYEHCKAGHYSGASHQLIEHLGNALDGPPAEDAATGGTT